MNYSLKRLDARPHAGASVALRGRSRLLMLGAVDTWNLGHALVSQESMHYGLSGLERRDPLGRTPQ